MPRSPTLHYDVPHTKPDLVKCLSSGISTNWSGMFVPGTPEPKDQKYRYSDTLTGRSAGIEIQPWEKP